MAFRYVSLRDAITDEFERQHTDGDEVGPAAHRYFGRNLPAVGHGPLGVRGMAERAGLPPSSLSRYLSNERDFASEKCDKLLKALGMILVPRYGDAPPEPWTIREAVIERAKARNWDYKVLADKSGLPTPTVFRFWRGDRDMTSDRAGKLLRTLEVLPVRLVRHMIFLQHRRDAIGKMIAERKANRK